MMGPKEFVIDYIGRHKHPVNAVLHIFGVPMAFYGIYKLFVPGGLVLGLILIFFGYLFQYLGHKAQGNEVGEVTLIKSIVRKLGGQSVSSAD
jgi:hypothetical protein